MARPTEAGLVRGIRRWDLFAFTVNGIIGAGIFGLPSEVYGLTGAASLPAFLVCAGIVTLIIMCFAEVSSRFATTGGPYLYAREAFGRVAGFEVGWMLWVARLTAFAANCNLLVQYVGFFWPGADRGLWRAVIITAVVVSLTAINYVGVRDAAVVGDVFTVGKLIPLALFVAAGLLFIKPDGFAFSGQATYGTFSKTVLLLVYAFTGFEIAVIPSGEVENPRRDLPFALLASIGTVTVLYTLIQVVCIGTLPGLAASSRPLADAGSRFLGAAAGSVISAGAIVSIIGNLGAIALAAPRLIFAMAVQQQLPLKLAETHRRFHTPHVAILISGVALLILTLSGTFIQALTISTIARLITYAVTCASLPILRRRPGIPPALFKAPYGVALSAAALLLSIWLLSNSAAREAVDIAVVALCGTVIYAGYRLAMHRAAVRA